MIPVLFIDSIGIYDFMLAVKRQKRILIIISVGSFDKNRFINYTLPFLF